MEWLTGSIREISVFLILVSIISNLVQGEDYKKYIRIVSGIIIILIIINPIKKIFDEEVIYSLFAEEYKQNELVELKKSMEGMNSEIYKKTMEEYEREIENKLKSVLEERGFGIENIDVTINIEGEEIYIEEVYIKTRSKYGTYDEGVGRSTSEFIKSYLWEEYSIEKDIIQVEY